MRRVLSLMLAGLLMTVAAQVSVAEDHEEKGSMKGSMHEGMGTGPGMHDLKITKEDMQNVMKVYIEAQTAQGNGAFELKDEKAGKTRRLSFVGLHEKLGIAGEHHYSCTDFKDLDSGEVLDVDIYVDMTDEGLKVADAVIHKIDGQPQFIYGEQGRMPADSHHMKGMEMKGSDTEMKDSGHEDKGSMMDEKGSGHEDKGSMKGSATE